jgi:FlaA1/EpsC-like NDP-sugar epimerase
MTIPEASQLVLQAGAMGEGGEIFILDMGTPVKIVDLARDLIILSGLRPDEDIKIEFSGVRPGEKLFEELSSDVEEANKTRHPKIFIGRAQTHDLDRVIAAVGTLLERSREIDADGVRGVLGELVPEYRAHRPARPIATSKPSDGKSTGETKHLGRDTGPYSTQPN